MNFRAKIRQNITKQQKGLELGPSFNPIAPKADGYDVVTIDHATRDELIDKYKGEAVELDRIEAVDVVWRGQELRDVFGVGKFDYIIASHVVEHVPCLISFMQLCQDLLKPNGSLYLLVPDKRYCFDVFRPLTSPGQVLDAYFEKRIRPSPSQIFDAQTYSATSMGSPNWSIDSPHAFRADASLTACFAIYQAARGDDVYRDVHCWVFVPSSFRLLVSDLSELNLIKLGVAEFSPTSGCEFYVRLSKGISLQNPERVRLMEGILDETGCYGAAGAQRRVSIFGHAKEVLRAFIARFPRVKLFLKRWQRRIRG